MIEGTDLIRREMSFMLDTQLKGICKSITSVSDLLDIADCKQYLYDRIIEGMQFKERKFLYVFCKHRLINMYVKEKRDKEIDDDFRNYYYFITENFELDSDTIFCLMISLNPKFRNFIPNDKFITGTSKLYYAKINKLYVKFVNDNDLQINPVARDISNYIINLYIEKQYHIFNDNFNTVEYDDRRMYNNVNNNDIEFDDEHYLE